MDRRTFTAAIFASLLGGPAFAAATRDVVWMWSGAITPTGATIKALSSRPGMALRLVLTPADPAAGAPLVQQEVTSDPRGVAAFVVSHLQPSTTYRYTITGPSGSSLGGQLKTFGEGPSSFRLGFASCAKTGSSSLVFEAIRLLHPDLFIHLGDLHYEDIVVDDVARFGQAYTRVLTSRTQGDLFRHVPIAYMWDDHDFGPNDSDRTSPSRRAAHEAYRLYAPHYPLPGAPARADLPGVHHRPRARHHDRPAQRTFAAQPACRRAHHARRGATRLAREAAAGSGDCAPGHLGERRAVDHEGQRELEGGLGAVRRRARADCQPDRPDGPHAQTRHAER
jgi:hypothetical protein